jgi:hypothetical protein
MSTEINNETARCPFAKDQEVGCTYQGCKGHFFIVKRIHTSNTCASGFLIVAHLKGSPDREIKDGTIIDGVNYGIDSGWFFPLDKYVDIFRK